MVEKQESLIYIESENITEAEFMSRSFVSDDIKNRAYLNALGAELLIKYLASEGIDASKTHNLHSISKILEYVDISDVMLPNIHLDTRVVFDENQIFIPKSHFEMNIVPNAYIVLKLSKDFTYVEFLGYIDSKNIDKKYSNSEYYFVEKTQLSDPSTLKKFIKNYDGNTSVGISESELLKGRELFISMADHNISDANRKKLIKLLLASDELRESVLEFDNFETLSFSVGNSVSERLQPTFASTPFVEALMDEVLSDDLDDENGEETLEDSSTEAAAEEEELITGSEEVEEEVEEEVIDEPVENDTIEDLTTEILEEPELTMETEEIEDVEFLAEELTEEKDRQPQDLAEDFVESLPEAEDFEMPALTLDEEAEESTSLSVEDLLGAAEGAIEAAADVAAADTVVAATVSQEAIKLAGMSGEMVDKLIDENLENQQKHLDKIDSSQMTINATEIPEDVAAYDLSGAKEQADLEAEEAGFTDAPMDLSALQKVENLDNLAYGEDILEQETINLDEMETIETDDFVEHIDHLENLENLSSIDSPTKPIDDLEEKLLEAPEVSELDFSNMSSFDINADGTSSIDNIDIDFSIQNEVEGELLEINMPSNELVIEAPADDSEYLNEDLNFKENEVLDLGMPEDFVDSEGVLTPLEEMVSLDDENEILATDDAVAEEPEADYTVEEVALEDLTVLDDSEENTIEELSEVEDGTEEPFIEKAEGDSFVELESILDDSNSQVEEVTQSDEYSDIVELDELLALSDEDISEESAEETVEKVKHEGEENWLEDTNYNDLQDIEDQQPNTFESFEENIEEQEPPVEEIVNEDIMPVIENSTIISDKTHNIGEIPIDINKSEEEKMNGPEQLEDLYNNVPGSSLLQSPGRLGTGNSKSSGGGVKFLGVLLSLLVVGAIGFAVSKIIKQPTEEAPQPIVDNAVPTSTDNGVTDSNTLNINPDNVVNMDEANSVAVPSAPAKAEQPAPQQKTPSKVVQQTPSRSVASAPFINVTKLSWEVPDYVSYSPQFKQYFQSTGKRLKLALGSDLLLATDNVHTNQVRVSVLLDRDGTFKVAKILLSSGSTQIDNIVLQTVNQTLKPVKAPNSLGNDESTTVILKIYF